MEFSIQCNQLFDGDQSLTITITKSIYKINRLKKTFKETLESIKFCKPHSTDCQYLNKNGNYELVATIYYPFSFPQKQFKYNFNHILEGHMFKTKRIRFKDKNDLDCFLQQFSFYTTSYQGLQVLSDNYYYVTIKYMLQRKDHLQIQKIINTIIKELKRHRLWVVDFIDEKPDIINKLLEFAGYEGEVWHDAYIHKIHLATKQEADTIITKHRQLRKKHRDNQTGNNWHQIFTDSIIPDNFYKLYNGRIEGINKGCTWVYFNYKWMDGNKPDDLCDLHDFNKWLKEALRASVHGNRVNYFNMYFETEIECLKFYYLMYRFNRDNPQANIKFFNILEKNIDGVFTVTENSETFSSMMDHYNKYRNSISLLFNKVFTHNMISNMVDELKSKIPMEQIKIANDTSKYIVVYQGGPASIRRIEAKIYLKLVQYKKEFLQQHDKYAVEIFSQYNLEEFEPTDLPLLVFIGNQYYDAVELAQHITNCFKKHKKPFLPYNRRILTDNEITSVIDKL